MKDKRKLLKRIFIAILLIPALFFTILLSILYLKQDAIVQELISTVNADFKGELKLRESHISLFANLPYVSIDLEGLDLYGEKNSTKPPILHVNDIYLGFDVFTLLKGDVDIRSLQLSEGFIHLVQDKDGEINLLQALEAVQPVEDAEEEFHMHLQAIELSNIDITKFNEENLMTVEAFVTGAKSSFSSSEDHMLITVDSRFVLNVIQDKDTTFFKHKHVEFDTRLDYNKKNHKLTATSSTLDLEQVLFDFEGSVDLTNDPEFDLKLRGQKPNFDMLMAFAPEELVPALKKYDNRGKILFDATIKGPLSATRMPFITASFSCEDGYLRNSETDKKLDQLNFRASFSNGDSASLSTMQFALEDFSSRPEAGIFSGHLKVKNFTSPEIDTRIISDFDLDFLSKFLGIKDVQDMKGKVKLTMNFRDVIDLEHPERAIEKLNESYFTELSVKGLGLRYTGYHLALSNLDIEATLKGHQAVIKRFEGKVGRSDISVSGQVSDLPAILHHSGDKVFSTLNIRSKFLDLKELTSGDTALKKPVDEQITDLSMKLSFKSSARAFTESPNLPVGEFFIDNFYAKLKHYPHTIHNFHADVLIDSSDFRIIDFKGMVDKSDFHFSGKLKHYDLWFADTARGDTRIDFDLMSRKIRLEDLFAYKGENYVPEDYRHEEIKNLLLKGHVLMHFQDSMRSADLYIDRLTALAKSHDYKFENFKGRVHLEDQHLLVQDFSGKLGRSTFELDLNYYLGSDHTVRKRDNHFELRSPLLDLDELFSYNPSPSSAAVTPASHEQGFNLYELPFTDMTFDVDVKHLNYHRYMIDNFRGKLRSTANHFLYVDTLQLQAADGKFDLKGYFNGSDKDKIYFSTDLSFDHVDLDKLLLKFENFGQDHLVSENVHGTVSGKLNGKLRMHRDMVPVLDESEIHMDIEVLNGRLEKYEPLRAIADYFQDKNIEKVLFDTLKNHLDMQGGVLSFPKMTINSSLGFIEVSGKQDMNMNMEYYFRIPMKLVTGAARQKLFGARRETELDPLQEDEIQYKGDSKNTRFINLKLTGNTNNYKISLKKDKAEKS